jgi:hypothetical protein
VRAHRLTRSRSLVARSPLQGWSSQIEKLPGVSAPFDPDTSYFDEAVAYTLGGLGLAWQLSTGFTLPFPLSLILLPLSIVEWLLRWQGAA